MESSTVSSRFRFRDHRQPEDSPDSGTSSDLSSVSSERDEESELESMSGKGIRRLCTELLEIKAASDEDFHRNIFSNYSAFVGIFEEVKDMEKELMVLRTHVSTQKRLVKDLIDGVYQKALSEETMESITEKLKCDELSPLNELEARVSNVSENLDVLLSENRVDEAIAILEMEEENLQKVQLEDDTPLDVLMLYNSAISERKAMITLQLTLVAENSRISAAELQKALVGICRLGNSHIATQLLLKYYHSRLAAGIHNLQSSESFLQGMYIKELSNFVFSIISQAARSFVKLYGETSPYASEFIQWVQEEIEVFAFSFTKYVKSVSEITDGLSAAVEAVQVAISYCSLLETQRLMLQPCLIRHLRNCMEDVLEIHIDHFKKVISIITSTDAWVLGRYLVSGILNEDCSYAVGQQPEYCLLTNSGRKFVTLLQAITQEMIPLAAIQMEDSILEGLSNLFMEYISILEKAMNSKLNVSENSGSKIILAESVLQQVSILANLSTVNHFFSSTVVSFFRDINCTNSELTENHSVACQQQELDSCVMTIQEASVQLRTQFFQKFICKILSLEVCKWNPEIPVDRKTGSSLVHGLMPSSFFQLLFLELRKLDKLAEDNVFEVDWLMELSRDLIKAVFIWISNNKEIWEIKENLTFQHSDVLNQFVLDTHFLAAVTKYEEYFPNSPLALSTLLKSAFVSVGLDPVRDVEDDGWAIKAAAEAIQWLLEIEKTELPSNYELVNDYVEPPENHSEHGSETVMDDARSSFEFFPVSEEDAEAIEASEVATRKQKAKLIKELDYFVWSQDAMEDKGCNVERSAATHPLDSSGDLEDIESKNVASDRFHFAQETTLSDLLLSVDNGETSEEGFPTEVSRST
ncbi:exocyst complex component EXO84B isoform X1 [Jatropha curcas]|uniref:exocyst complex component EXO84B isoform X1 n=2 Tax=Jatropha curcas TaxID=180498 RepID=UPI0009D7997B|nr:exocyst complex component EXO84B isoform X1 [Jatropha curcas]